MIEFTVPNEDEYYWIDERPWEIQECFLSLLHKDETKSKRIYEKVSELKTEKSTE